jgi:hypothetical protein
MRFRTGGVVVAVALVGSLIGCGARSKRDMSMPPREVTYSDACALQDYFDQRLAAGLPSPSAADEMLATNEKGQTIGEGSYVLKDPLARRRFARMLREEYSGVDHKVVQAVETGDTRVIVKVKWWDAGPIKRLRTTNEILVESSAGELELPPNLCVSDMLFGEKVYAMRARYLRNEVDLATDKSPSAPPSEPVAPVPSMTSPPPPAPSASATN